MTSEPVGELQFSCLRAMATAEWRPAEWHMPPHLRSQLEAALGEAIGKACLHLLLIAVCILLGWMLSVVVLYHFMRVRYYVLESVFLLALFLFMPRLHREYPTPKQRNALRLAVIALLGLMSVLLIFSESAYVRSHVCSSAHARQPGGLGDGRDADRFRGAAVPRGGG